jgi:hypothetical protein
MARRQEDRKMNRSIRILKDKHSSIVNEKKIMEE